MRHALDDPFSAQMMGIGPGDTPAFDGMHEASAAVAGGSLAAMDRILDGSEMHAFHPGGGLHHAMPARASGFCVYDDPALAIARARAAGLRVLYVDLDVHHGDGVQTAFSHDPAVLTISLHESGHWLFPGTGFVDEIGEGRAAGTAVNVPFEPGTSDGDWLDALERLVPALALAHGPDVLVSQNGCDSHILDPLAHLNLTTRAMHRATRLLDGVAHRHCGGCWLATGGGGYDIHRVVPRSWALVWSAQAHLELGDGLPDRLPAAWRERWSADAERAGDAPLPEGLLDPESLVADREGATGSNRTTVERAVRLAVPALLQGVIGGADGRAGIAGPAAGPWAWGDPDPAADVAISGPLREIPPGMDLAAGVLPIARPAAAAAALSEALGGGAHATAAVVAGTLVGLVLIGPRAGGAGTGSAGAGSAGSGEQGEPLRLLACGVAGPFRRQGLGRALLARALQDEALRSRMVIALVTPGERDPLEPDAWPARADAAAALLLGAGFAELSGTGWALGVRGARALEWAGPEADRGALAAGRSGSA